MEPDDLSQQWVPLGGCPPQRPSFLLFASWLLSAGNWRPPLGRPCGKSWILKAALLERCMCPRQCRSELWRHASPFLGHPRVTRTLDFLRRQTGRQTSVPLLHLATHAHTTRSWPHALIHMLPIPVHHGLTSPWNFFIGLLPSKGNTVIMILIDHLSKACKIVALATGFVLDSRTCFVASYIHVIN